MNSWIFQFITDHPVAAFFLSWPTLLLLLGAACLIAFAINGVLNFVFQLISLFINGMVVMFHGYAPSTPKEEPVTND